MDLDGKKLIVQQSSFLNAMALKRVIGKALRNDGITLDLESIEINDKDLSKSKIGKDTLGSLIENIIAISTDEEVMKALLQCCEKVVLFGPDKEIVDIIFFEEHREYYYPIMIEVLRVNLTPFFGKISSMLPGLGDLMQKFQKSK